SRRRRHAPRPARRAPDRPGPARRRPRRHPTRPRRGRPGAFSSSARRPSVAGVDDVAALTHTRQMGKGIWPAVAVGLALVLAAPASAATMRHASPDGVNSGSNCTDGEAPCSLKRAVEAVAMDGDEVVLAPGLYEPPSAVAISRPISVHGQAGQPRPRVVRPSGLVFTVGSGGTLADV